MKTSMIFVGYILSSIALGAVLAALVNIDISLAAKILISVFLVILVGISASLGYMHNLLTKILFSNRASFVSLEKLRLDPENEEPALRVLLEDMREEREEREAIKEMGGGFLTSIVVYAGSLFIVVISARVFHSWVF